LKANELISTNVRPTQSTTIADGPADEHVQFAMHGDVTVTSYMTTNDGNGPAIGSLENANGEDGHQQIISNVNVQQYSGHDVISGLNNYNQLL
jgi:hypothetical protein